MDSSELKVLRRAVADYISSEGCSCCSNIEAHEKHADTLGKLLKVDKYPDGSGYDFKPYRTASKSTEGRS